MDESTFFIIGSFGLNQADYLSDCDLICLSPDNFQVDTDIIKYYFSNKLQVTKDSIELTVISSSDIKKDWLSGGILSWCLYRTGKCLHGELCKDLMSEPPNAISGHCEEHNCYNAILNYKPFVDNSNKITLSDAHFLYGILRHITIARSGDKPDTNSFSIASLLLIDELKNIRRLGKFVNLIRFAKSGKKLTDYELDLIYVVSRAIIENLLPSILNSDHKIHCSKCNTQSPSWVRMAYAIRTCMEACRIRWGTCPELNSERCISIWSTNLSKTYRQPRELFFKEYDDLLQSLWRSCPSEWASHCNAFIYNQ